MQNYKNLFLILVLFSSFSLKICSSDRPASCLDILKSTSSSLSNGEYSIYPPESEKTSVFCDFTSYGGGWTRVSIVKDDLVTPADFKNHGYDIDDLNLNYREVFFKSLPGHYLSYERNGIKTWYAPGFSLLHNFLKFNAEHYYYWNVNNWRGCGARNGAPFMIDEQLYVYNAAYFDNNDLQVMKRPNECRIGSAQNFVQYCATELIVRAQGRLSGFGDMESITGGCTGDNEWHYNAEIYVR